jgi:hypothetical protein
MSRPAKFLLHKIGLLFLLVLCWPSSVPAQQCKLKIDQLGTAAELRGFRLWMTFDEIKARVPQVRFGAPDEFGVTKTSINPGYDPSFDQASFADVRTISFDFLDGKLTTLWIGYENSFKWPAVDEFVEGISKSLNLPATWSPKKTGKQIQCDGFTVFVSMIAGGPSVRVSEDAAEATIALRREQAAAAAELLAIGDTRTKLYYSAGCAALEDVPKLNRIRFKDKEEAEKAGYKLAKACE